MLYVLFEAVGAAAALGLCGVGGGCSPELHANLQVSDDAVVLGSIQATGRGGRELRSPAHHQVPELGVTGAPVALLLEDCTWHQHWTHDETGESQCSQLCTVILVTVTVTVLFQK